MSRNISEQIRTLQDQLDAINAITDQITDRTPYEKNNLTTLTYRAGQLMMASLIKHDILLRIHQLENPKTTHQK